MSQSANRSNHPEYLSCPDLSGDRDFSHVMLAWQEAARNLIS
jgi:hypothetical protein